MVGARATPLWAMIRLYIAHQKGEDGILVSAAKASLQWTLPSPLVYHSLYAY